MSDDTTLDLSNRDERALGRYRTFQAGANLAEAIPGYSSLGRRAGRIAERIRGRHEGLDFSGAEPPEFDWQASPDEGITGLIRAGARVQRGRLGDYDQAMNRLRVKLNTGVASAQQRGMQEELMPSLDQAQGRADEMVGTAAIPADKEMALRSSFAAQIRMAANTRIGRTASLIGYGNMSASPAAAALVQQEEEQADQAVVGTMRDLGLQINEMNRTQARADIDLASRITAMRHAVMTGNPATLATMQKDVASIIDALYARDRAMEMAEKELKEAGKQSTAERIGQWVDIGKGVTSMGMNTVKGLSMIPGAM